MPLTYTTTHEMYGPVQKWLLRFLGSRFKGAQIRVHRSSSTKLPNLFSKEGPYEGLSPDWPTWEIRVDIVGVILNPKATHLVFVDCKSTALTFDHLAHSVGKARIARPTYAFLLSPQGPNSSLTQLLKTHRRLDVLEYTFEKDSLPRSLIIARWDANANTISMDSVITSDIQKVELGKF